MWVGPGRRWGLISLVMGVALSMDSDMERPVFGDPLLETFPGPGIGPYKDYVDALVESCQYVQARPAEREGPSCLWLYYSMEQPYFIGRLSKPLRVDPERDSTSCLLPWRMDDPRYPPGSSRSTTVLYSGVHGSELSDDELYFMVLEGERHSIENEPGRARAWVSIALTIANARTPPCDGFHEYIPITGQFFRRMRSDEGWRCEVTGEVSWVDSKLTVKRIRRPCQTP
ncbi:hypothetical protein [Myxococcus eversor]|nr:hypothetical protein [Myxococcus eversor]